MVSSLGTILNNVLLRMVTVHEVTNNQLELSMFFKKFYKLYQFWINGEITYFRYGIGWLIYIVNNLSIFVSMAHVIRYIILYDEFSWSEITIDISICIALPLAYFWFKTFYKQQKGWQKLLLDLGNFEHYEKPEGLELHAAKSEVMLKVSMVLLALPLPAIFTYVVTAHCPDPEDYSCGLIFPGYFPGCMGRWRPYCGVIHIFTSYSLTYIGYLASCLYSQISEYLVIYVQHLQKMLQKIPTYENWEERWTYVNHTIKYHQRILELYETYYFLVKDAFLVHVFGSPVILAILIYSFKVDFKLQNFAYAYVWLFSLSFACFFGQRMVDESEKLTEIVYQSIPFDGDNKTTRSMQLFLFRSQQIMHIPAGSLTFCGKDLYVSVLKSVYSYVALMQTMSEVDNKQQ